MANGHMKKMLITNHQENANQYNIEKSLTLQQKDEKTTSASRIWREEFSYTVGGEVNWPNPNGKQPGDRPKSFKSATIPSYLFKGHKTLIQKI